MFRSFDAYGQFEQPQLILCNPDGKELYQMSHAIHIKATMRFNAYSELDFEIPKFIEDEEVEYYDLIQKKRWVKVEGYGVFEIDKPVETRDGIVIKKNVNCKSIDSLFATKSLINFEGTYKLYDTLGRESIMSHILEKFPDWSIDSIDGDLLEVYRTYNISEQNLYDLMMNDLSEDFQCVFIFDTFNKKIKIKTTKNAIKKTDIFVSFENLLKDISFEPVSDSIKTSLEVYGADNLSIHDVNPLGGTIYNFDYFKTTEWMSQSTINALTVWENKVKTNQLTFANNLSAIKTLNNTILSLNIQLVDLNSQLKALEGVLASQISGGISPTTTNGNISAKNVQITNKKNEINARQAELDILKTTQTNIQNSLKFTSNFTSAQLKEINSISSTTGGTYVNDSFVKTSSMSVIDIQEESQRLMDVALTVLEKESQPRYTFSASIVNFLALEWANKYAQQLELGCEFTVAIDDDKMFYPVLLEYPIDFDNLNSCSMTFCNSLRLSNAQFDFASIFSGVTSTVSSVSTSKGIWEDYIKSGDKGNLNSLKNDALDLATKDIISSSGQSFVIDQTGIRGKKLLSDGINFSPNQLWMTNNSICMTQNNWQTSSLAIGEITFNGVKKYGIVASLIVGDFVASQSLVIKNQNNTVSIDALGFNATNANITLNRADGSSQIILNPSDGIKIRSKVNGTLIDTFYVDTNGNLRIKGDISGSTGTFSGSISGSSFIGGSININNRFIVDSLGNCTATSINISGNSTFTGNITASVLTGGTINGTNINGVNITGTNISGGTISGTTINGGTITGATINGGTINISTDANIGSRLNLKTASGTGIYFDNGSSMYLRNYTSNPDFFFSNNISVNGQGYFSSQLSVGSNLYVSGTIYANNLVLNSGSFATKSYVDSEISYAKRDIPVNAVYNSSSKLLKFYNNNGNLIFDVTL